MTDMRQVHGFPRHFATAEGEIFVRRVNGDLLRLAQHCGKNSPYRTVKIAGTPTTVHRLVALAFLGPRPMGEQVRHLNGDAQDNRAVNLRYGTASENNHDKIQHGTMPVGESHGRVTHSDEVVRQVVEAFYESHLSVSVIAELFGLSRTLVGSWVYGWSRSSAHDFQTPHGRLIWRPAVAS